MRTPEHTVTARPGGPLPAERERDRRTAWRRWLATGAVSILPIVAPATTEARDDRWSVSETATTRHHLALAAGAAGRLLEVDSLGGTVAVVTTAAAGEIVEATVVESRFGDGEGDLARARREVRLALREEPGAIRLIVEAPGCPAGRCGDRGCFRDWRELGYEVRYDIDLAVPAGVDLILATVDGPLRVTGARGNIRASNVNGPVELIGVSGDGSASGVNGPVTVRFAEPPREAWSFSSVNGRLEVASPPGLAADLAFRTLNGEIWTDFPYESLPPRPWPAVPPDAAERGEGHFVFRSDPFTRVRISGGGPELTFETVNGDILVRRADTGRVQTEPRARDPRVQIDPAGRDPRARTPTIEE